MLCVHQDEKIKRRKAMEERNGRSSYVAQPGDSDEDADDGSRVSQVIVFPLPRSLWIRLLRRCRLMIFTPFSPFASHLLTHKQAMSVGSRAVIRMGPVAKTRNSTLTLKEHQTFLTLAKKKLRFENKLEDARPLTADERQNLLRLEPLVRAEQVGKYVARTATGVASSPSSLSHVPTFTG